MQKSFMRIPYTGPLPPPVILPRNANTPTGAIYALSAFLSAPSRENLRLSARAGHPQTVLLTGAGISVASGLADYRGTAGTYTLNKAYRPIYYNEFIHNHEARKRYWARSFIGWTHLYKAKPNHAHKAIKELGNMGFVSSVITQNVDSFHPIAHPELETLELHGCLRFLVCIHCRSHVQRSQFQEDLSRLNPSWATFLAEMLKAGALDTENPEERRKRGLKTNPDGDVDLPGASYSTFRYPACPTCLGNPPLLADGTLSRVDTDEDGAWSPTSTAGVLKPAVIMFGESIPENVKAAAEEAVDHANRILVIGSSLATYSAWRLVKRAKEGGLPIGILNIGGVRGEEVLLNGVRADDDGSIGVRCSQSAEKILPRVVEVLSSNKLLQNGNTHTTLAR